MGNDKNALFDISFVVFHRKIKYGNGIESSLKWLQNFKQNGKETTQVTIMNEMNDHVGLTTDLGTVYLSQYLSVHVLGYL